MAPNYGGLERTAGIGSIKVQYLGGGENESSASGPQASDHIFMKTKTVPITLGPFFTAGQPSPQVNAQISALRLAMEWSNSNHATSIPLFRSILPYAPDRTRLEHILFRTSDLPCDIECLLYQAIDTPEGTFIPLDALLLALYRNSLISRTIFQLLNELAAVVPLRNSVTSPISTKGLLSTEAEARGFRLNAAFEEAGLIYAQIGWEAECSPTRFHVCAAVFRSKPNLSLDEGKWIAQQDVGASQILSDELHRLVPGKPSNLLKKAGLQFLQTQALQTTKEAPLES